MDENLALTNRSSLLDPNLILFDIIFSTVSRAFSNFTSIVLCRLMQRS